jgi:hypothetical protein
MIRHDCLIHVYSTNLTSPPTPPKPLNTKPTKKPKTRTDLVHLASIQQSIWATHIERSHAINSSDSFQITEVLKVVKDISQARFPSWNVTTALHLITKASTINGVDPLTADPSFDRVNDLQNPSLPHVTILLPTASNELLAFCRSSIKHSTPSFYVSQGTPPHAKLRNLLTATDHRIIVISPQSETEQTPS